MFGWNRGVERNRGGGEKEIEKKKKEKKKERERGRERGGFGLVYLIPL